MSYKEKIDEAISALEEVQNAKECEYNGVVDKAIAEVLYVLYDEYNKL